MTRRRRRIRPATRHRRVKKLVRAGGRWRPEGERDGAGLDGPLQFGAGARFRPWCTSELAFVLCRRLPGAILPALMSDLDRAKVPECCREAGSVEAETLDPVFRKDAGDICR